MNAQKLLTFEIGTEKRINVPTWIILGFEQKERQDSQKLSNDTFYRPPMTSAQCIIGTRKYPDSAFLLNYDDNDNSQGYGQINETFKALTKDDVLRLYISENVFRLSNDCNNIGYNLYSFDIRYQKNFESAQPIKVEFKFSEIVIGGIYAYVLIFTNKLISISSDDQRRHFDLL